MSETIYDIPDTINELFHNGEREYRIVNYDISPMDNNQSLGYFMDLLDFAEWHIEAVNGTQAILKHMDFPHFLQVDAGGLGDMYSHSFRVTEYNP